MESVILLLQEAGMAAANSGDVFGIASVAFLVLTSVSKLFSRVPEEERIEPEKKTEAQISPGLTQKEQIQPSGPSWSERLTKGLAQARGGVWGKIGSLLGSKALSDDLLEEVEELLYGADIGPSMVSELIDKLSEHKGESLTENRVKEILMTHLQERFSDLSLGFQDPIVAQKNHKGPRVVMVVGVNGAGKTTTIGKLATKWSSAGAKVLVGACDTFRAAAVDQLQVWCDRAKVPMKRAKEGANPTGVAYETLETAQKEKADICLIDTAGRLHTMGGLMDELAKMKKVLGKLDESAPHDVLLVIDSITGQNALRQAEEFNKALGVTGLVFTKCDGSSKAGSALGIMNSLNVPVGYIGVGESVDDLNPFSLDDYLSALLDYNGQPQTQTELTAPRA